MPLIATITTSRGPIHIRLFERQSIGGDDFCDIQGRSPGRGQRRCDTDRPLRNLRPVARRDRDHLGSAASLQAVRSAGGGAGRLVVTPAISFLGSAPGAHPVMGAPGNAAI